MKNIFLISCIIYSLQSGAQKTETYYDYRWKPCDPLKARFYSTVEKTDSGWLRYDYFISGLKLQMKALFEDSTCKIYNGQSVFAYANGNVSSAGGYVYNKKEGVCVSYYSNGVMSDSATYHNDIPIGNQMSWWRNGIQADSTSHVNDSMDVEVSWFDDGTPSQAGYLLHGKMQGKWKFFHRNGQIAAIELYDHGRPLSKEFFNEDGSVQTDTAKTHADATCKGGLNAWQNYLGNKLFWPTGYKFSNGDQAVVVVDITINEVGKVENVEVSTPFHPAFDQIALDVVRKSPPWNPRILHNRRVKANFRQPVNFEQEEN